MRPFKQTSEMTKKAKPEINIGHFSIAGTSDFLCASQALQSLFVLNREDLIEARYKIGGKTIIIKPLKSRSI